MAKEVQVWQEDGGHVIILTDFNDDVTHPDVHHWADGLGLVEAITWLHQASPPPTYQRGQRPIDGIFAAPQLLPLAASGYCCLAMQSPVITEPSG